MIPGPDGLFVLQLNADGTEDQMRRLMDATDVIDEQTTITPWRRDLRTDVSMTPPPLDPNEPPPPQRGQTREERGRDISEAQAEAEAETSKVKQYLKSMSPRYVLSMAEGYPVVLKQFIQFCLIIIYPAWVFGVLFGAVMHAAVLRHGLSRVVAAVLAGAGVPEEAQSRGVRSQPGRSTRTRSSAAQWACSTGRPAPRSTVTPDVVRPRQTVTATVTTDKPIDKVTAATLEWGYTNFYRYRWAGRADSAAAADERRVVDVGRGRHRLRAARRTPRTGSA